MNVSLVPATPDIIPTVLENVRARNFELCTDKTEIAKDLRTQMLVSSHCYAGLVDGDIAVVWGVMTPSIVSGVGIVWVLTTELADDYPIVFARRSKIELDRIKQSYSELVGYVNSDYERSVRWLRWLGFKVGKSVPMHGIRVRKIEMKGAL